MMTRYRTEAGFSLVEVLIATGVMLAVSGVVTGALVQMSKHRADNLQPHGDAQRRPRRD